MQIDSDRLPGPSRLPTGPTAGTLGNGSTSQGRSPVLVVPRTNYIHIEYPGVIRPSPTTGQKGHDKQVQRALITLAPEVPPYGTPASALSHVGRLVSLNSKVIECKPWADEQQDERDEFPGGGAQEGDDADMTGRGTGPDLFRRPLLGDLVETHNYVAVVHRRVWRRKAKRRAQSENVDGTDEVKEYKIEPLGVAKTSARWRKMADYLYQPDLAGPLEQEDELLDVPVALRPGQEPKSWPTANSSMDTARPTTSSPGAAPMAAADSALADEAANVIPEESAMGEASDSFEDHTRQMTGTTSAHAAADTDMAQPSSSPVPRGGLLNLYDALARMDVGSLRSFSLPEEKEQYTIDTKNEDGGDPLRRSNLRMVPPPSFGRSDPFFVYGFRQASKAEIADSRVRGLDGLLRDGRRWENRSRREGLSAHTWSLAIGGPVPKNPPPEVAKSQSQCDPELLAKVKDLFDQRPIWTRAGLLNQLPLDKERRLVGQVKQYISSVAYMITDATWNYTLVRLGFDVRESKETRFYQKLQYQVPSSTSRGRSRFKDAYGGAHASGSGASIARRAQAREDQATEVGTTVGTEAPTARRGESPAADSYGHAPYAEALDSHTFDGENIATNGSFLLVDILDPMAQPYIQAAGEGDLLSEPTVDTGWYSSAAWERIKEVVRVRAQKLWDEKRPATKAEVEAALVALHRRWEVRAATRERSMSVRANSEAAHSGLRDGQGEENSAEEGDEQANGTRRPGNSPDDDTMDVDAESTGAASASAHSASPPAARSRGLGRGRPRGRPRGRGRGRGSGRGAAQGDSTRDVAGSSRSPDGEGGSAHAGSPDSRVASGSGSARSSSANSSSFGSPQSGSAEPSEKRGRGRPKGSKNKQPRITKSGGRGRGGRGRSGRGGQGGGGGGILGGGNGGAGDD